MDFISDKSFNKVVQSASREIIIVLKQLRAKTLPQALENIYLIKARALKLSLPWPLLQEMAASLKAIFVTFLRWKLAWLMAY